MTWDDHYQPIPYPIPIPVPQRHGTIQALGIKNQELDTTEGFHLRGAGGGNPVVRFTVMNQFQWPLLIV